MNRQIKRPWPQILGVAIGFVSAMALYNVIRKIDSGSIKTSSDAIQVGNVESIEGQLERRPSGAVAIETVPGPGPIYHQDLLITQRGSSAVLRFEGAGTAIKLKEATRIVTERDPARADAVIATILDGDAQILEPGKTELIKFYRNGAEVALADLGQPRVPTIQAQPIEASGPKAAEPAESARPRLVITATKPRETPEPAPAAGGGSDTFSADVLTNDDIFRQMRRQSGLFQRCYLSHIHRTRGAQVESQTPGGGTLVVAFTIESNGKVSEARLLKSDFSDKTLESCVLEVVSRTTFKGFTGKPVPVLEFPITLQ